MEHGPVGQAHLDPAISGHLERCGMGAVFFGLLRHQSEVLNRTCGRHIKRSVLFEELDRLVIDRRIAVVWDHAVAVALIAIGPPALAAAANERGHGGIDDHV